MSQKKQPPQSKLYRQWKSMRYCCDNPNNNMYRNHGALGITYAPEWSSFAMFEKWALSNGYQEGCSLRRKNKDGNFSPENCEWRLKFSNHGMSESKLYVSWKNMLARCYNQSHKSYKDYGGRGISVTSEWETFIPFKEWALSHGYKDGLTIDRIDNNGNYEPNNCRWADNVQQCNNRRSSVYLTYNKKTLSLAQWGKELGISRHTLWLRLQRGLPVEEILNPQKHSHRGENHHQTLITFNGITLNQKQWAERVGVSPTTLGRRLKQWGVEKALTQPPR